MGIFSKWSILEKVEDKLEMEILHNPIYPFTRNDPDPALLYSDRSPNFYISCVVSAVCGPISIIWVSLMFAGVADFNEVIIFPIILFSYFSYRATMNFKTRSYKVNLEAGTYQFFIGDEMRCEGHLHNLYIRLKERITTGLPYYEMTLNGYNASCVSISGLSKNIKKMRELGKGISKRLTINYFDCKDRSSHHVVHWERPNMARNNSSSSTLDDDPEEELGLGESSAGDSLLLPTINLPTINRPVRQRKNVNSGIPVKDSADSVELHEMTKIED